MEMMKKKKWIKSAVKKSGALHKALKIPEGEDIPDDVLAKAAKSSGKLGKMARLAQTLKGFKKSKKKKRGLGDSLVRIEVHHG